MASASPNPRKPNASGSASSASGPSTDPISPAAPGSASASRLPTGVVPISPLLFWAFSALIARRRLRKNFRALRIANLDRFPRGTNEPLIVYLNHPSWWDPLTCIALAPHLIGRRRFYGPIEEKSLQKYRTFRRLGLFPVEIDTPRGAAQFLRAASAVLRQGDVLGLTPQGRFTDARTRPPALKTGLGALLTRMQRTGSRVTVVPLALEYTFWDERLPEILVNVGEPILPGDVSDNPRATFSSAAEWTHLLDQWLATTQDELASLALTRSPASFQTLLEGGRGEAGFYGMWQRLQRKMRGIAGVGGPNRAG